jgi:predicted PurR-regulated permease PerM
VRSITSLLGLLTTIALVPVLLFYTLKDYPQLRKRIVKLFPTFGGQRDYLVHAGSIVGDYLRGQITISAIAATLVSVALILFGVPFALLIGLLTGLLNMIPNLGIMFTYFIGVLIALIFGDPWYIDAIIVLAVLMGESFLEQSVLTPNILGQRLGLHPVVILLSLFIFGYFLGLFGLLIAVPATALIVAAYRTYQDDLTLELAPQDANSTPKPPQRSRRKKKTPPPAPKPTAEPFLPPEPEPTGEAFLPPEPEPEPREPGVD